MQRNTATHTTEKLADIVTFPQRSHIYFDDLPLKTVFNLHGNTWIKTSSRTARLTAPADYAGVWCYFRQQTLCTVSAYCRLGSTYFNH